MGKGRPKKIIDEMSLLKLRGEGKNLKEMSKEMGVSVPTLSRRIAALQTEKGVLSKYRQLQGLQLTGLQARLLEAVAVKNLEGASLNDLVRAFYVLKKVEISINCNASSKITRLMEHLIFLEDLEKKDKY